jgi:hypothetical protein
MLWRTTQFYLAPHAIFTDRFTFTRRHNPFPDEQILLGPYQLRKQPVDANTYRIGHPLAQRILGKCCALDTPVAEVCFQLSGPAGSPLKRIAALEPLVGRSGWLQCARVYGRADHRDIEAA